MTKTKKIVIGALLSLATLGSAASYAGPGGMMGGFKSERMVNKLTKKLDLTDVQKQNLEALRTTLVAQAEKRKENNTRKELVALLAVPVLDETKALAIIEEKAKARQEAAPAMISAIANFTNSLNDEQRAKLTEMSERMGKRGGKRRHKGNK